MGNTPEYTKRAINNYNNKFDRLAVNTPKGTKERIKKLTGLSCNAYASALILSDLERLEKEQSTGKAEQEQEEEQNLIVKPEAEPKQEIKQPEYNDDFHKKLQELDKDDWEKAAALINAQREKSKAEQNQDKAEQQVPF